MKKIFTFILWTLVSHLTYAQFSVSGKVVDQEGQPIPFATIFIDGTYLQTQSNFDGSYLLNGITTGKHHIIAQYVGLQTEEKEIEITEKDLVVDFILKPLTIVSEEVIIEATREGNQQNGALEEINKDEIEKKDFGQDLPFLLDQTPSVVVTSDAGAGVGYTGIRLRGSDATRINVTINGIPLNDSESHGVYWVDIPDISGSTQNIQIQRGVGSSTHGAGAFGGSINLLTNTTNQEAYAKYSGAFGSFNTLKNSVSFGTGLIKDHWSFDGRISQISSDGYIDRASSNLKSYYLSAGYFTKKTLVKAILFGGYERTYQAWAGVPLAKYENDSIGLATHLYNNSYSAAEIENLLNSSSDTYNPYTYKNQVDNYNQDHFQLHLSHQVNETLKITGALHYTYGRGYYESYKEGESLSEYNLLPILTAADSTDESDIIRRKWLSNDFYGVTSNINYEKGQISAILGGGWNLYDGDHYGKIIWAQRSLTPSYDHLYYANNGKKVDGNTFAKVTYKATSKIKITGDLQMRWIDYRTKGIDETQEDFVLNRNYTFFNPKFSINYQFNNRTYFYAYVGRANREPVRSDFIDSALKVPLPEQLTDYEIGYQNQGKKHQVQLTGYFMNYKNQLILTGALNNVGDPIHDNAEESYRQGVEFVFSYHLLKNFNWRINATLSKNKIKKYTQLMDDYTNGYEVLAITYNNTDISYSPNIIVGNALEFTLAKYFNVALNTKYVGDQYLDNTMENTKKLNAYLVNDLLINFKKELKNRSELTLGLKIGNILNEHYANNGYTYSYKWVDTVTETFVFPQAGRNYLVKFGLSF